MTNHRIIAERIAGPIDELAHEIALGLFTKAQRVIVGNLDQRLNQGPLKGDWEGIYAPALRARAFERLAKLCTEQAKGWKTVTGQGLNNE